MNDLINLNPVVLFRRSFDLNDEDIQDEYTVAQSIMRTTQCRTLIPNNSIVIGRYSMLPYYQEVEQEIYYRNSEPINTYEQHRYIADITNYTEDIKGFTPETYTEWGDLPDGEYVVKGRTNSRKFRWNTHMYANNKTELLNVIRRLMEDMFISDQGIIVRKYVPLEQVDTGINGLPICKEWRCFFYKETLLAHGYYWSSHCDNFYESMSDDGIQYVKQVAAIIAKKCNFFVLDVAKKADGGYIVIEANDGQMSGLSLVNPRELYTNLKQELIK